MLLATMGSALEIITQYSDVKSFSDNQYQRHLTIQEINHKKSM